MNTTLTDQIRDVLNTHARLSVDAHDLGEHDDLFQAGMSSHASIELMLAIEEEFDIEFPDSMLKRDLVESIAAIESAVNKMSTAQAA